METPTETETLKSQLEQTDNKFGRRALPLVYDGYKDSGQPVSIHTTLMSSSLLPTSTGYPSRQTDGTTMTPS
jgi:hypothetical protein